MIVVTAFYSSGLHGELFDVFINLRHARLEAAGWLLDLGAPWLLHLTCALESSITCPAWGQDDWWDTLQPWRRLSCVQREQFGYMHTLLVCDGSYLH